MAKSKIIHWHYGCRFGQPFFSPLLSAYQFLAEATTNPDWVCVTCAKAARLALAAKSAPKRTVRCSITGCGSYAINPGQHGRTEGADLDLCDVCYWRKRAESAAKADTRTDSDRYAELRRLVEAWKREEVISPAIISDAGCALYDWRHR